MTQSPIGGFEFPLISVDPCATRGNVYGSPRPPANAFPPVKEKKPAAQPPAEASFEETFAALEEIVARMESADLPLAEMISAYEQGARHHARCEALLADARRRIEAIQSLPGGAAALAPFTPAAAADESAASGEADDLF
jgi:exodeoxyribonuclease VII small subunit